VLVLALIAELGGFGWRSSQLRPSGTVSVAAPVTGPPPTVAPTTVPVTVPIRAATTTTSTTGPRAMAAPVSAPGSLTYTVAAGTTVKVTATGACWMEARPRQGGPVTLEKTLAPGQSQTFTAPVWIRFGDPTMIQATVGTTRLQLPVQAPSDLILLTDSGSVLNPSSSARVRAPA
jgi:hypothetical protein